MRTVLCFVLLMTLGCVAADALPDPSKGPAGLAQVDVSHVGELLQNLIYNLIQLGAVFLAGWKLLHDHHDRMDARDAMPPTPEEQAVLDKFSKLKGVAAVIQKTAVVLVCAALLFCVGCGGDSQQYTNDPVVNAGAAWSPCADGHCPVNK